MKSLFIFLVLSYSFTGYCQKSDDVFIGQIKIKGGESYVYKLQFSDSNGFIKGYSITDVMGPDETKTAITGKIDTDKDIITFRETHLVTTKSKTDKNDFCFIHGKLKISTSHGVIQLKGHFEGFKEDGVTSCAKGEITMANAKQVMDQLMQLAAKMDSSKKKEQQPPVQEITDTNEAKIQWRYQQINPGETQILQCDDTAATIAIWDNKDEDGDMVDLLFNNKMALADYTIVKTPATIHLSLHKNSPNTLRIVCVSEGSEPTNTARLKITCGNMVYTIDAITVMGKDVFIELSLK